MSILTWLKLQWHYLVLAVSDIPDTYRWWKDRILTWWRSRRAHWHFEKWLLVLSDIHDQMYSDAPRGKYMIKDTLKNPTWYGDGVDALISETRAKFHIPDWQPRTR